MVRYKPCASWYVVCCQMCYMRYFVIWEKVIMSRWGLIKSNAQCMFTVEFSILVFQQHLWWMCVFTRQSWCLKQYISYIILYVKHIMFKHTVILQWYCVNILTVSVYNDIQYCMSLMLWLQSVFALLSKCAPLRFCINIYFARLIKYLVTHSSFKLSIIGWGSVSLALVTHTHVILTRKQLEPH